MAYSPKYITREDVPVQVPDNYNDREKNAALEFAESTLELDLNDGDEIDDSEFTTMMTAALRQKATCELVKGAEDPNSTKLGDLSDDGTTKSDYANVFCERYNELIEKITESGAAPGSGSDQSPYIYTTSKPDE